MAQEHPITFGPFHVDITQGRLWRGAQGIAWRPQALALLRYLVEHPGRLVTKAELRRIRSSLWGIPAGDKEEVMALIEQKTYCVLHALRQTGTTTCLLALMAYRNQTGT